MRWSNMNNGFVAENGAGILFFEHDTSLLMGWYEQYFTLSHLGMIIQ